MARFNFTNITLQSRADITEVMNNFNKIEQTGAIIDDLSKRKQITLTKGSWVQAGSFYEYKIIDDLIKAEPYRIDIYFSDLSLIKSAIFPKANSQAEGSLILRTTQKPTVDLVADLIVTKVVV